MNGEGESNGVSDKDREWGGRGEVTIKHMIGRRAGEREESVMGGGVLGRGLYINSSAAESLW